MKAQEARELQMLAVDKYSGDWEKELVKLREEVVTQIRESATKGKSSVSIDLRKLIIKDFNNLQTVITELKQGKFGVKTRIDRNPNGIRILIIDW